MRNDENAWTGRFTCTEEIDEYLGGETLHCLLCWKFGVRSLGSHLKAFHGGSGAEYRERYGIAADRSLDCATLRAEIRERIDSGSIGAARRAAQAREASADWEGAFQAIASGGHIPDVLLTGKRHANPASKMPTQRAWYQRIRNDPEFARRVKQATEGRPGVRLGEETLAKVEAALRQGRSVASLKSELGTGKYTHNGLYKRWGKGPSFR